MNDYKIFSVASIWRKKIYMTFYANVFRHGCYKNNEKLDARERNYRKNANKLIPVITCDIWNET